MLTRQTPTALFILLLACVPDPKLLELQIVHTIFSFISSVDSDYNDATIRYLPLREFYQGRI